MLPAKYRLVKNSDFKEVYKKNKKAYSKSFLLLISKKDHNLTDPMIAFVASKKVGNAVYRNSAKRRMRAIVKEYLGQIKSKKIIFILNNNIHSQTYSQLKGEVEIAFKRSYLIQKKGLLSETS